MLQLSFGSDERQAPRAVLEQLQCLIVAGTTSVATLVKQYLSEAYMRQ